MPLGLDIPFLNISLIDSGHHFMPQTLKESSKKNVTAHTIYLVDCSKQSLSKYPSCLAQYTENIFQAALSKRLFTAVVSDQLQNMVQFQFQTLLLRKPFCLQNTKLCLVAETHRLPLRTVQTPHMQISTLNLPIPHKNKIIIYTGSDQEFISYRIPNMAKLVPLRRL